MGWQISAGKMLQLYHNTILAFSITKRHKTQSQKPFTGLSLQIRTPNRKGL